MMNQFKKMDAEFPEARRTDDDAIWDAETLGLFAFLGMRKY